MLQVIFLFFFIFSLIVKAQNHIIVDESSLHASPKKNQNAKAPTKPINKKQVVTKPTPVALPTSTPQPSAQQPSPTATKQTSPPLEEELKLEEPPSSPTTSKENANTMANNSLDRPKFKNRKAFTIDYNTWYELLKIKDKTTSNYGDSKAHYFGIGLYYDYTIYEEKYGYAFSLGTIFGNTQAGTINTGEYYERRIPWLGYRAGGRLFFRANTRIDIGPALLIQYKETRWPEETNFQVMPQINPQYFIYIDTRWRISYPLELIQSFGFHTRQYALVWRLGINYTLN